MKITISTFAIFFVYGLFSLIYIGKFVSPIFLSQLAVTGVSLAFLIMNRRTKGAWMLSLFFIVQLAACVIDGFTVSYLSQKLDSEVLLQLYNSKSFAISFLILYFGFFIFITVYSLKFHANKLVVSGLVMLLLLVAYLLVFQDLVWLRDLSFALYVISFVLMIHKLFKTPQQVYTLISYLMLLSVMLEGLEYFQ